MKYFRFALFILIVLVFSLYTWQGCTWYVHDIVGAGLHFGCDVIFYGAETQQAFTIAAGCPGKDLVQLWLLPVKSPWDEDWWEPVEGVTF